MNRLVSSIRSTVCRSTCTALALFACAALVPAQGTRAPQLPPGAEALQVPAGHVVSFRAFATGFQIYRWDAAANAWIFAGPSAFLFAERGCHQLIGLHFGGPTWLSNSGSSVVGSVVAAHSVDPTAVPWLRLVATKTDGPGIFARTTFIQRIATVGGRAPSRTGTPNEVIYVPYAAEYYFYRAR